MEWNIENCHKSDLKREKSPKPIINILQSQLKVNSKSTEYMFSPNRFCHTKITYSLGPYAVLWHDKSNGNLFVGPGF